MTMIPAVFITKKYTDLPFGHRQWKHDGHCKYVHGHNLDVELDVVSDKDDPTGFVVDFGNLKWIKAILESQYDHTLLICVDDPMLERFKEDAKINLCDLRIVDSTSAEAMARWILDRLNQAIQHPVDVTHRELKRRGVRINRVTVWEDSKNSATAHFRY